MSKASANFTLGNIDGKHGVKEIKRELDALAGLSSVSVSDSTGLVAVDFDTTGVSAEAIKKRLENLGYEILNFMSDEPIEGGADR